MKNHRYLVGSDFRNKILSLQPSYTSQPITAGHLSVTIFTHKTKSVLTISRHEKKSQRFHQCITMLSLQPVIIHFHGYHLTNQPFVLKELSVRGVDYHDIILTKPPYSSKVLNTKALKSYNWIKKLHGLF